MPLCLQRGSNRPISNFQLDSEHRGKRILLGASWEEYKYLGGKQSGHGDDMGELERAATRYIAAVMLGLMGLGAGLALLGVWFVVRTRGATSARRE